MVEWASGASERTFNQSAANGREEHISIDGYGSIKRQLWANGLFP
jgi:hypothetical protein